MSISIRSVRLRRPVVTTLALAVAVVTAACDDEEPVAVPLTASEAELLGVGMWRQGFSVGVSVPIGFGTAADVPVAAQTVDVEEEVVVACDLGGRISNELSVSSVVDEQSGGGEASITIVQTHEGCAFEEDGTTFTVEGAPNVTTVWEFEGDGAGNLTIGGSIVGGVSATAGEASGLCPVDLAFSGSLVDATDFDFTVSGEVCGQAVSRSVSASVTT